MAKKIIKKNNPITPSVDSMSSKINFQKYRSPKYLVALAVIILLALVLWKNKSLLVVATVNGKPVPRWELEGRMVSRYGTQTLDEVINEELIRQAGNQKGITVSQAEITAKISEVEGTLQGKISLSDALAQQGMTIDEFHHQVELQLILDKLTASSIVVTDKEVAAFIASNSASLVSTDPASQSAEARKLLISQKKNSAYRQMFTDLKAQAKISKFL